MKKNRGLERLVLPEVVHDGVLRGHIKTAITRWGPQSTRFKRSQVVIVQFRDRGYAAEITADTVIKKHLNDLSLKEVISAGFSEWSEAVAVALNHHPGDGIDGRRLSVTRFELILDEGLPIVLSNRER